ncbi:hypothetical protein OHS33_28940 [Streptomyces sp. NBC_00536]|uniref:hypothetical protein n=1 Tax=Streptomyces sp. NBC_00536 TaxID=2975769 RepID=UPI002E8167C3|nr:hypothetical protein [Streptomyces sp. NBC_00536]WUC82016.1 hypothetical protein OHS33_28940 [Streptomyces sp. NBC_00536]
MNLAPLITQSNTPSGRLVGRRRADPGERRFRRPGSARDQPGPGADAPGRGLRVRDTHAHAPADVGAQVHALGARAQGKHVPFAERDRLAFAERVTEHGADGSLPDMDGRGRHQVLDA